MGRAAALLGVLAALAAWYAVAPHLDTRTQAFSLTLRADHASFTGGWHYTDKPGAQHAWPGTRRGAPAAGWAGTWDVVPRTGVHEILRLKQAQNLATGSIELPDGGLIDVHGRVQGATLSFAQKVGGWSTWPAILFISLVLIPACGFLVWLALPLWSWRWNLAAAAGFLLATIALSYAGVPIGSNFCKLAALTLFGWWFLSLFEAVSWVVIVALIIPWVDAYSVWRGPTRTITEHHAAVFGSLSIAYVVPGGAARLGVPDVLFYALFLAASVRFGLRPAWTWLGLTVGLSLTMICATWWNVAGLPALPGIALGFLIPNADLLVRRLRLKPVGDRTEIAVDGPPHD